MANVKHMKRINREQALKIRRLQRQGGTEIPHARSASNREVELQNELQLHTLRTAKLQAEFMSALDTMQSISKMTKAKEARETAGAFLARHGR